MKTAVIISVTSKNTIEDLEKTLWSLAAHPSLGVYVIISQQVEEKFNPNEVRDLFPKNLNIKFILANQEDIDANNFYEGIYSDELKEDIITFLKCGDLFVGIYMLPVIEQMFEDRPELLTVNGKIDTQYHLSLYSCEIVNMQGWFFRRGFLDYYTFLKIFTNDAEFALHLSYIATLQPQFTEYIDKTLVSTCSKLSNTGEAFVDYFNNILPQQTFFNPMLGTRYLYELVCECYISYIQAVNLELPEDTINQLIEDICIFYQYFGLLELEDVETLLEIYNKKMKKLYLEEDKYFTSKIPDITLVGFLEIFQKRIDKEEE